MENIQIARTNEERIKMENIQIARWNLGIIEKVQIERYNPKL